MSITEYRRPRSIAEASELLSAGDAVALAGGTDLVVGLRHGKVPASMLVDLKSVEDLRCDIVLDDGRLVIGARVVMAELVDHPLIARWAPSLAEAAAVVGSVQIRNRATLAGNLCNASPAADTAPVLLAHDAAVFIAGRRGARTVPVTEFFAGPGRTVLEPGELVVAVGLPATDDRFGSAFARVTRRRGVDLASVNLACVVRPGGEVRFGFGAVAPTPVAAVSTVDDLATEEGIERLLSVTSPISDVRAGADYRRAMLRVHSRRALDVALARLRGRA
jgi:carbon-monoxide dehydrogenase medium subunit